MQSAYISAEPRLFPYQVTRKLITIQIANPANIVQFNERDKKLGEPQNLF